MAVVGWGWGGQVGGLGVRLSPQQLNIMPLHHPPLQVSQIYCLTLLSCLKFQQPKVPWG